jgi:hypothetical protein
MCQIKKGDIAEIVFLYRRYFRRVIENEVESGKRRKSKERILYQLFDIRENRKLLCIVL